MYDYYSYLFYIFSFLSSCVFFFFSNEREAKVSTYIIYNILADQKIYFPPIL